MSTAQTIKKFLLWAIGRGNTFPVRTEYPIIKAFTWNGVEYFRYDSIENTPANRMLAAMRHYIQLKNNCDEAYLRQHYEAVKSVYGNPKKIDLSQIIRLNELLGERIRMGIPHPDLVLKYASVVYFDKNESPYTYDDAYNEKKIQSWKAGGDLISFFLQEPIRKLVPVLSSAGNYTQMHMLMRTREIVEQDHLENLYSVLSMNQSSTGSNLK